MILNHRPSILSRPAKAPSKSNQENLEREYEAEQQRIRARAERQAHNEERIQNRIYSGDNRHEQEEMLRFQEQQMQAAAERKQQEREEEQRWAQPAPSASPSKHPWAAATYNVRPVDQAVARRQAAQEAARENMRSAQLKRDAERREKFEALESERAALKNENGWWNRGAASEKWIPREHRVRGKGGYDARGHSNAGSNAAQWSWQAPNPAGEGSCPESQPQSTHAHGSASTHSASRAPWQRSPEPPHHRQHPAPSQYNMVTTGGVAMQAPYATEPPATQPRDPQQHLQQAAPASKASSPRSVARPAPFYTAPSDGEQEDRSVTATSHAAQEVCWPTGRDQQRMNSDSLSRMHVQAPFGRDDQRPVSPKHRHRPRDATCPFGRDTDQAPADFVQHLRAPYPYARPLVEKAGTEASGTLPPSRPESPEHWKRGEEYHRDNVISDRTYREQPYQRSPSRPEQRTPPLPDKRYPYRQDASYGPLAGYAPEVETKQRALEVLESQNLSSKYAALGAASLSPAAPHAASHEPEMDGMTAEISKLAHAYGVQDALGGDRYDQCPAADQPHADMNARPESSRQWSMDPGPGSGVAGRYEYTTAEDSMPRDNAHPYEHRIGGADVYPSARAGMMYGGAPKPPGHVGYHPGAAPPMASYAPFATDAGPPNMSKAAPPPPRFPWQA